MKKDFEDYLRRQSIRPVPAHWREEILRAARPQPQPAVSSWWRQWLWPCPQAWAGLAAVWMVILGINVSMGTSPSEFAQATPAFSHEALLEFRQQQAMLTGLIFPEETPEAEPPKTALPRRSELRQPLLIV